MPMLKVPIHGDTLAWGLRRSRLAPAELARRVGVTPERLEAWQRGDDQPTYRQATELARHLGMPFPALLVPPPERVTLPVRDLRRGPAKDREPSPELLEAIYDALRKRDWFRDRRLEPLPFVGSIALNNMPDVAARAISKQIPVHELQDRSGSWEDFLRRLVRAVEESGVLVLRQGYVGANTRRTYDPEEFSGFAIVDRKAPIIFLNARDPVSRQVFTLAHELVHVWLGESGVDGPLDPTSAEAMQAGEETAQQVERFADRVAAELLMPKQMFERVWHERVMEKPATEVVQEVARMFRVSRWAALRRARELGLLSVEEYIRALDRFLTERNNAEQAREVGGGDFWATFKVRNSPTFTQEVARATREGEIDLKEAAVLLNVSLATVLTFLEKQTYVSA